MPVKHYFYSMSLYSRHTGQLLGTYTGLLAGDDGPSAVVRHVQGALSDSKVAAYLASSDRAPHHDLPSDVLMRVTTINNLE